MTLVAQFVTKYLCLDEFDRIWERIPPYPGYRPPQKRYRQITMWSGPEMHGVNRVLLACFTAALHNLAVDAPGLAAAAQVAAKQVIRCLRYLTDFCPIAQYHSHTAQTMRYMDQCLQKFYVSVQVFTEFRAMKQDRQDAKEASRELAAGQLEARQARLEKYFELSATQRNRLAVEDR